MYEMPYRYEVDGRNRTYSPVLQRMVELSRPMLSLVRALNTHGYVDPIRDGGRVGTFVALMERGILRPAKGRYGRHYPAHTPEQVWDEAHGEHNDRQRAEAAFSVVEQERAALIPSGVRQCLRSFMPGHEGHTDGITGPCHLSPPCPRDDHAHLAADSVECFEAPEVIEALPEGAITTGVGGTCLRTDGEHATHGYARQGEGCTPSADPMDDENLPMGASRTLVTGETQPSPSFADDVEALRAEVEKIVLTYDSDASVDVMLALLDRIEAQTRRPVGRDATVSTVAELLARQDSGVSTEVGLAVMDLLAGRGVPQQAVDADGRGIWQHACGNARHFDTDPAPTCSWCYKPGPWQRLYALGGDR